MPKAFDKCAKSGRIRTVKLSARTYKHVCFKGRRSYSGYTKTRKGK